MTLDDVSRMFFSCYYFFPSSVIFYLTQNPRGNSFWLISKSYLLYIQKINKKWMQFLNILFLIRLEER